MDYECLLRIETQTAITCYQANGLVCFEFREKLHKGYLC